MAIAVLLNIVAQVVFFLIGFAVFGFILDKAYDFFFSRMPKWIQFIVELFLNIFYPLIAIVRYIILTITFNKKTLKSESPGLLFAYITEIPPIWHAHKYIGWYVFWLIPTIVSVVATGLSLKLLLPETFISVRNGVEMWSNLVNQEITSNIVKNAVEIIYDTFWKGLILGGCQESFLGFLIFISLTVLGFSQIMGKFFEEYLRCTPTILTLIVGFNIIFAMVDYQQYTIISSTVNSFGMFALLAFVFISVCCFISIFFQEIIKKLIKS